ncbi:S-adenosyl-L-methionine-dependent methyltransferase [Fomitiporia mediterranea MF3/22]|uniref:S-adenosyl-L-methionine-dependent methyltransferase n=1 Tax=Fomitiporia mediterranea (strain MF3/22) TaxID=694068 RepID=UPI000440929B|nr:S-adenosyl-L-methionine-dependent methyltransferase [Fomitiporia mediterranea MF3/22]EJD07831.1 S-adenosyl-L-methionine-dependent methyltransferase [Fomitiporia mediterranea MF3/22]
MAAFAKASFNAKGYAASRPTYPRQLFDFVFRYHEYGSDLVQPLAKEQQTCWDVAVDLGCGTGQATAELRQFKHVIGVDPSKQMLVGAQKYTFDGLKGHDLESARKQFLFVESQAENLGFLENSSVDLVIAAQAAHWFNWKVLWPELARVLRPHGTVAVWGYSEMRLSRYPSLTPIIDAYTHGPDPATSLGPHWQQPGRSIVENLLQDIPSASSIVPGAFSSEDRVYFSGSHFPSLPNPRQVILHKKMRWTDFEDYLRSFSSLHTFQVRNPDDANHPDGDVVKRFINALKTNMGIEGFSKAGSNGGDDAEVEIEWPLALILAKRS